MNTYENIMDALGKTAELTRANSENTAIVLAKLNAQETLKPEYEVFNVFNKNVLNCGFSSINFNLPVTGLLQMLHITSLKPDICNICSMHCM